MTNVVLSPCRGLRAVGSTACAMTLVAAGRADGYYGAGFHIWDIAAPSLIISEAGGVSYSMKGEAGSHKHSLWYLKLLTIQRI